MKLKLAKKKDDKLRFHQRAGHGALATGGALGTAAVVRGARRLVVAGTKKHLAPDSNFTVVGPSGKAYIPRFDPKHVSTLQELTKTKGVPVTYSEHAPSAYAPPIQRKFLRKYTEQALKDPRFAKNPGLRTILEQRLNPKGGVIIGRETRSLPVLAHELAHARMGQSRLGRTWLTGGAVSRKLAPLGIAGAAFADPDSKVSKYAPAAAGLAWAPTLVEEGRASIKGHRALKKGGFGKKVLTRSRKGLGRAFGTYALGAAGTVGAALAARAIRKRMKRKALEQRQAEKKWAKKNL
jgi:hypothetical protein